MMNAEFSGRMDGLHAVVFSCPGAAPPQSGFLDVCLGSTESHEVRCLALILGSTPIAAIGQYDGPDRPHEKPL